MQASLMMTPSECHRLIVQDEICLPSPTILMSCLPRCSKCAVICVVQDSSL